MFCKMQIIELQIISKSIIYFKSHFTLMYINRIYNRILEVKKMLMLTFEE